MDRNAKDLKQEYEVNKTNSMVKNFNSDTKVEEQLSPRKRNEHKEQMEKVIVKTGNELSHVNDKKEPTEPKPKKPLIDSDNSIWSSDSDEGNISFLIFRFQVDLVELKYYISK